MTEPSAPYRFGSREGGTLNDIPSDVSFLSWSDGYNAAAVLCAQAEDALLREHEDSPSDSLDRAMLAMSLARQWSPKDGESGVLTYVRTLHAIQLDEARRSLWHNAVDRSGEGAQRHRSQPLRALELYREALQLFESLGDEKGAGRCRGNIGLLLLDHQHTEEGVGECMSALELHAHVNYDRGCLMHLGNVIGAAQKLQRWEDALNLGRERIPVALRSDPSGLTAVHADNGWFAWQMGRRNDAESSYREAVAALDFVQTYSGLERQIGVLGPLAHALGHADELQNDIPRLQQQINRNLQSLDVAHLVPSGRILDRFREAVAGGDHDAIYEALAQSECWSSFAFERALAQHAIATLIADDASAQQWNAVARHLALAYCRSFLDRGPFDEYSLYTTWPEDKRLVKARAYALKLTGIHQATVGDHEAAHVTLHAALELHALIGDRDATANWFPEAFRELLVSPESRGAMHRLMFRASQQGVLGLCDDERRTLEELLDLASREGAALDVVDACTRLAVHFGQAQRPPEAAEWFARAEQGFRALESIGISVRAETGRAHNKLKMSVHLLELLEQTGRFGEAAFVGVAALREADWFIESFQDVEYVPRVMEYKSRMLHALSRSYERLGVYEKALAYADQLHAWAEQIGDRSVLGAAYHSRALALRVLMRPADALASAQADLDVQRALGNPSEIAVALVLCAELSMDVGDTAHGRELAAEAIALAVAHPTAASSGRDAKYTLARLAQHEGALADAIRLYSEILAEEEALPGPGWIATASVLAERLRDAGHVEEAISQAQRAWEASKEGHSLPIRLNAGCALARCQLETGESAAVRSAIDVLVECCRAVDTIRGEMADESHKTSAAIAWVLPFEMLLSAYLAVIEVDPDPTWKRLAFDIAEHAKARALAESIAASAAREAEAMRFRFTGLSVRPEDPREAIARPHFTTIRDMLRHETGTDSTEPQALA